MKDTQMIYLPIHHIKRNLILGVIIILLSSVIFFAMQKLIQEGFDFVGGIVVVISTVFLYFLIKVVFTPLKKVPLCDKKGLYLIAGKTIFDTENMVHIPWEDISHFEKKKIITGIKVVIIHFKDDVKKLEYVMQSKGLQSNMGILGLDDSCYFMTSSLTMPQHQLYTLLTDFLENGVSFDESIETKIKNIKTPKSPFPWKMLGLFTFHWGMLLAISITLWMSISAVPFLVNEFEVIAEYSSLIASLLGFVIFGFPLYSYHHHFLDPLYQKHCYEDMFASWWVISLVGVIGIFFLGLMSLPVVESISNSEFDMGIVYVGIPMASILLGVPYWMILRNKK